MCLPAVSAAQSTSADFSIRARGQIIGSENVKVDQNAEGTTISATGRFGPPVDIELRSLQIRYDAQGRPLSMRYDASVRSLPTSAQTTVSGPTASNTLTPPGGQAVTNSQPIDPAAVLLPNPFVAPFEMVARRLRTAAAGTSIPIYQPAAPPITMTVDNVTAKQIQTLDGTLNVREATVSIGGQGVPSANVDVWADEAGHLLRVSIPAQQIEFVREDIGSVSTRIVTMSRPNDEDVRIPANGFSLAGTLSKPKGAVASQKLPAVLLIGGSGPTDRDEVVAGIPIFGQLTDSLADAGFAVLRYDKRGVGQSGGRPDSATLADFADDARAAVRFLDDRKDIDDKRIAVVGHSEGGWIALMVAADKKRVAAVGLIATVGMTGAELNLYQVQHASERRPEAERNNVLALQKQIQQAVITGKGWESINVPPQIRKQAETPYFQSFLTMEPAKLMKETDQPILIVQGGRDTQVPASNAQTLEQMAKARKKNGGVDVVMVPDVNHILIPAVSGEVDEYRTLPTRTVSASVTTPLVEWLRKTLR